MEEGGEAPMGSGTPEEWLEQASGWYNLGQAACLVGRGHTKRLENLDFLDFYRRFFHHAKMGQSWFSKMFGNPSSIY